jgi:RimJ/RimL family protein N-acetyltransferase
MPDPPVIETERLLLRCPEEGDLDGFCGMMADAEAMTHLGGVMTRPEVWRFMSLIAGSWMLRGYSLFSVVDKASGEWLGRVGPWAPEGWPGTEIGWGLKRSAWGRGYAQEAAIACMDFAFDRLGWDEVIHVIVPENTRSLAVAQRLGSTLLRSARLPRPADIDVDIWGQSRDAWKARRQVARR